MDVPGRAGLLAVLATSEVDLSTQHDMGPRADEAGAPPEDLSALVRIASWRELLDVVGDAILIVAADGAITLANREAAKLFPALAGSGRQTLDSIAPELAAGAQHTAHGPLRLTWRRHDLEDGYRVWRTNAAKPRRDTLLAGAGRLVEGTPNTEKVAAGIVRLAAPVLADAALIVLPATRAWFDWWRGNGTGPVERGRVTRQILLGTPGLADLFVDTDTEQLSRATVEEGHDWLVPHGLSARSVLLVPLGALLGRPGVLVLVNARQADTADDELVAEFTRRAAGALGAALRLDYQAELTLGLESSLLPAVLPTVPGVSFAAAYRPARAGLRVGGDFYDVHPQADGTAVFALGDACGHGPEAAALAGHVRSCLGALRLVEQSPAKLLGLLNHAIRTTSGSRFTTAVVGNLAVMDAGRIRLTVAAAGHPPPLVSRADGGVTEIALSGGLLGIYPDVQFGQADVNLGPHDVCLLYSDGITEARRGDEAGEQFGLERLRQVLRGHAGAPAAELVEAIHAEVDAWLAGRYHDDITVLAIQADPPARQ